MQTLNQNLNTLKNKIARTIAVLRRVSPVWMRKLISRQLKDAFIDLEWMLYRSHHVFVRTEVSPPTHPILVISIPKNGTHLLRSILLSLPKTCSRLHLPSGIQGVNSCDALLAAGKSQLRNLKPGSVYSWHLPYFPEIASWLDEHEIKRFFIFRDPRDYTVSLCQFIMKNPPHPPPAPYFDFLNSLRNDSERLMHCIRGFTIGKATKTNLLSPDCLPDVNAMYRHFIGWRNDPNTCSVRYSDLASSQVPKSKNVQKNTFESMLRYLGVIDQPLSNEAFGELLETGTDPKKSPTFRLGKVGHWKQVYRPEHKEATDQIASELLLELGYL